MIDGDAAGDCNVGMNDPCVSVAARRVTQSRADTESAPAYAAAPAFASSGTSSNAAHALILQQPAANGDNRTLCRRARSHCSVQKRIYQIALQGLVARGLAMLPPRMLASVLHIKPCVLASGKHGSEFYRFYFQK